MGTPRRRALQAALIASVLGGCASPGTNSGRYADAEMRVLPQPYQAAYRNVRDYAKDCYEAGLGTAEIKVDSELFTDIKRGQIRIYMLGLLGRQNYYSVDLNGEKSATATEVSVRRGDAFIPHNPDQLDRFFSAAAGDRPDCHGF